MNPIGFMKLGDRKDEAKSVSVKDISATPVKSLAKVRFASMGKELAYYNDQFILAEGDAVYVGGKMAGQIGVVTSVTTKFRIHSSDYQKVLAKLDLEFHGHFVRVQDKMICHDDIAITPTQFQSWVTPPVEKKKEDDGEEDVIISGDGDELNIDEIMNCPDVTPAILHRALDYCKDGLVRYICIENGVGRAFVEGTKWYRVDFRYENGRMSDIYCECPYPELCKHEVAVALNLNMLAHQKDMDIDHDFVALDRDLFWKLASRNDFITV